MVIRRLSGVRVIGGRFGGRVGKVRENLFRL